GGGGVGRGGWLEREQPALTPCPPSGGDPVPRAPADENVEGPHPGPVEARPPLAERLPQSLHRSGSQTHAPQRLGITQRLIDRPAEALADPPVEGKDESPLRPLEEAGGQSTQPGAAKRGLAQHRLVADAIR